MSNFINFEEREGSSSSGNPIANAPYVRTYVVNDFLSISTSTVCVDVLAMEVTVDGTKSSPQPHHFRQLTRITYVAVIDRFTCSTLDFDGVYDTHAVRTSPWPGEASTYVVSKICTR